MRIVIFANNRLGCAVTNWLRGQGEEIAGVVLHPPSRQKFGPEIVEAAGVKESQIFDASRLEEPATRDAIGALNAEMGISVLFGYILRRSILDLFTRGCINIHPALLPYNRGAYPNVWSIVDGTPAGVTLHYIDEHVDTGDIIAQREVLVDAADTGGTLYDKLGRAAEALFCETWPLVRSGKAPRIPQGSGGTYHRVRDAELIDEIDLDRPYKAGDLINILRARSFPPHRGAYFRDGNRKVYIELSLISEQGVERRRVGREPECPQN
jgi:methionyl-tRNA formyltransferase